MLLSCLSKRHHFVYKAEIVRVARLRLCMPPVTLFLLLMVPILELFVGLAVPQGESALTPARSETKSVPRQVLAPDGPIGIAEHIEEHDLYLLYVDLTREIIFLPILSDFGGQN